MAEEVVIKYIDGELATPSHLKPLVCEYNRLKEIVEQCKSYPRSIDESMNKLYDAMVVLEARP